MIFKHSVLNIVIAQEQSQPNNKTTKPVVGLLSQPNNSHNPNNKTTKIVVRLRQSICEETTHPHNELKTSRNRAILGKQKLLVYMVKPKIFLDCKKAQYGPKYKEKRNSKFLQNQSYQSFSGSVVDYILIYCCCFLAFL